MTTSRTPAPQTSLVSPVVDYEPPPVGMPACRSTPMLRRRTPRPLRAVPHAVVREAVPPHTAVVFADAALRRVLEVIDRRRPIAQLRPLLAPALIDTVVGLTRSSHAGGNVSAKNGGTVATLRRTRLRTVDGAHDTVAEVFGTYSRGPRVRAIAARIELNAGRWRIVALQIG
jgi:Family of unknown function (DUF6459)